MSRKSDQYKEFLNSAEKGRLLIVMTLYPREERYWLKNGFTCDTSKVTVCDRKLRLFNYVLSFDHSYLLKSADAVRYIEGTGKIPNELSIGQKMYLISIRVQNRESINE